MFRKGIQTYHHARNGRLAERTQRIATVSGVRVKEIGKHGRHSDGSREHAQHREPDEVVVQEERVGLFIFEHFQQHGHGQIHTAIDARKENADSDQAQGARH